MTQDIRLEQLKQWVRSLPGWGSAQFAVASADASFRRYFRATIDTRSAVVMDAPPEREDSTRFIDVTRRLLDVEAHAPLIIADNLAEGFLLLQDFGNTPLLQALTPANVDQYYQQALQELLKLQTADTDQLPVYNATLLRDEMALMPEWFLRTHMQLADSDIPQPLIEQTFTHLSQEILKQPTVFVHRDYHSRNLMLTGGEIGVIDHQDAVLGPVTYDLVSLLRDCYIAWPQQRVERWALSFHKAAINAGMMPPVEERLFLRWFDLTGLQRHLKVLGIFSRLHHRDSKDAYLQDLPLVLSYILTVGARHPETSQLVEWLHSAGIPQRIGTVDIPT